MSHCKKESSHDGKKNKKVLVLLESLARSRGTEKLFSQLSFFLSDDYDIVYVARDVSVLHADFDWPSFELRSRNMFFQIFELRNIIAREDISCVIGTNDIGNITLYFATLFLHVQKIATIHSNPLLHLKNIFKTCIIRYIYPSFDFVVCVSRAQQGIMQQYFSLKNTRVIQNFMDISTEKHKLSLPIQKHQKIHTTGCNSIMVGRLDRLKGFLPLLRVWKQLVQKYPDNYLYIVGEWPYESKVLEYISQLWLKEYVFLLWQSDNIYTYTKQVDVFVFPSLSEAFGMVLVESLLSGNIIVSSDCPVWPREILWNTDEKIQEYPHTSDRWILVRAIREETLQVLEDDISQKLIPEEQQLLQVLIDVYENLEDYKTRYQYNPKNLEDFDITRAQKQWKDLLGD